LAGHRKRDESHTVAEPAMRGSLKRVRPASGPPGRA